MPEPTTPPTETKVTPPTVPPAPVVPPKPEIKPTADAWASIARKEKALLQDKQAIAEEKKRIAARDAEIKAWEEKKANARLKPIEWLKEGNLTVEELTKAIINDGKPSTDAQIEAVRQELTKFKAQTEEEKKQLAQEAKELAEKRNQENIQEFKGQINAFVDANKEDYDLIALLGAQEMVFQGVVETNKNTGRVPTIKEAADGVVDFLTKKLDEIVPQLKWFKAKYQAKEQPNPPLTEDGSKLTETLSNNMNSGMGFQTSAKSEEERVKRALAALEKFD
jgi:hypothetical protein